MDKDTLAIRLDGAVPVIEFAKALGHFAALITLLSKEVAGVVRVEWEIAKLESSSPKVLARGISPELEMVERVILAYGIVGQALQSDQPIPYSAEVVGEARQLVGILNGRVKAVTFLTPASEIVVDHFSTDDQAEKPHRLYAVGTITGTAVSLLRHPGLQLTLTDAVFNRAVSCHFSADYEERMRVVWGKTVSVTGLIHRDPLTGRPVEVRNIFHLEIVEDAPIGSFRQAAGVFGWQSGDEPAEITIRRLRDADQS